MTKQITSTIMMIRPVAFRYNEQTAVNNYYQKVLDGLSAHQVNAKAQEEFDAFVNTLRSKGVDVLVIDDTIEPNTPDSIFPNNWISFHSDGRIALYPMCAKNRRLERRMDIVNRFQSEFEVSSITDFTAYENSELYLEGTGSMLFDRENKIVYAALSVRTDESVLDDFCDKFNYKKVCFTSNQTVGDQRLAIYHTNVMMCLGETFAVLCADTVDDAIERANLVKSLQSTGKEIIYISEPQKHQFAGNMLQLQSYSGKKYLVMSASAHQSLNETQVQQIEKHCEIISSSLDTIEACGGGSARCMMAEVFLPKKT